MHMDVDGHSAGDMRYISVVVCFAAFLINDLYGFLCWRRMEERQKRGL